MAEELNTNFINWLDENKLKANGIHLSRRVFSARFINSN
jgi:hypothetical protein